MDNAMVRDASAAASATITMHLIDGQTVNINLASVRGLDKVISTVRWKSGLRFS